MTKKSKSQVRKEKEAGRNSQFDPKIHELSKVGYGFQMKQGYKSSDEELSGKNLPFTVDKKNDKRKN